MPRAIVIGLVLALSATAHTAYAARILLIEDQGGFGGAAEILIGDGHTVTVSNNEFLNGYFTVSNRFSQLSLFDFVVYGERGNGSGARLPGLTAFGLEMYIQGGGHLLVTGFDTLGVPPDATLATLIRSVNYGDRNSRSGNRTTADIDNFILNGPFGDFRNFAGGGVGYDDDLLEPNLEAGAVALGSIPGVTAWIIFTDLPGSGGSVGYWNGGLPGTITNAQPDFSDGTYRQAIFQNWAAGTAEAAPPVPEPATLSLVVAGLVTAAVRRRRRAT